VSRYNGWSASLSPRRGSGMQIAATGFRLQCLHVVRKGRYVMHRADRAYTRCVYSYYPIPILAASTKRACGLTRSAAFDYHRRRNTPHYYHLVALAHASMRCIRARTREREREKEEEKKQWIFPTAENLSPTDVRRAIYKYRNATIFTFHSRCPLPRKN